MKTGKPRLGILDPRFQYVPAAKTDIRKTFDREKIRLQAEKSGKLAEIAKASEKRRLRD